MPQIPARYKALDVEFSGGMGTAALYMDTHLDRRVIIKSVENRTDVPRLMDEIRSLQRIRSRHVVEIYDVLVGDTAGDLAIVEDYVSGPDLEHLVLRGTTTVQWLDFQYQISSAVGDVHSQGVIHRDISPRNIKQDEFNYLKLFDFGLSRPIGPASSTVGYRGTLGFSAPELFSQGQVYFSESADVYALGSIAWYIATGAIPDWLFKRSMDPTVEAPSFTESGLVMPADICSLVDAALSLDPQSRPSAQQIVDRLRRELLKDRHRALILSGSSSLELNSSVRAAQIGNRENNFLIISYDGYEFGISEMKGDVSINNRNCQVGDKVAGACVIVLGGRALGPNRTFATFDVSYPEVML